jgi:hypothetical protein
MRRLRYRKRGFATATLDDGVLYEKHGSGPSMFVVVRGARVNMRLVLDALQGKVPEGTPLLRLGEGEEIEIWEEEVET